MSFENTDENDSAYARPDINDIKDKDLLKPKEGERKNKESKGLTMKIRAKYFLAEDERDIAELFDYIQELHQILWIFVKDKVPNASGVLNEYLDEIIPELLRQQSKRKG